MSRLFSHSSSLSPILSPHVAHMSHGMSSTSASLSHSVPISARMPHYGIFALMAFWLHTSGCSHSSPFLTASPFFARMPRGIFAYTSHFAYTHERTLLQFVFRPPTHFSHMSHPTFPISHLLFFGLSFNLTPGRSSRHSGSSTTPKSAPSSRSAPRLSPRACLAFGSGRCRRT